ncbi:MAG: hypothetical protein ACRD2N_23035 [Vicinamibacterales bacterium]
MPKTFVQIASEAMAHVPSRLIRWAGLAAILGAAIWWTSWILNSFTKDGSVAVLGLSEPGWRTVANAALLSFIGCLAGIAAAHASRAGKLAIVGFLTTLLSLVMMLAGNVIEFWVAADPGWFMILFGFLVHPIGLILLGVPVFKANVLPRWGRPVPLGFGAILGLMLVVAMVRMATGIRVQEKLATTMIMTIGLGWMVLGCALWSGLSAKKGTPNQHAA